MLTISSAPPAAWLAMGPVGLKASSQIDTPTRTPADLDERRGAGAGREVALLVEHGVVRQVALVVHGLAPGRRRTRPPRCTGRGRRRRSRPPRRTAPVARGHPVERPAVVGDEAGLEQQVLGRVAGDGQLGEHGEVAALRPRPRSSAASTRSTLPSRSPTMVLIWHSATRRRATPSGYRRTRRGAGRRSDAADGRADGVADRTSLDRAWSSAAPTRARSATALDRLDARHRERLDADPAWPTRSSPSWPPAAALTRLLETDPAALDVLADLDAPAAAARPVADGDDADDARPVEAPRAPAHRRPRPARARRPRADDRPTSPDAGRPTCWPLRVRLAGRRGPGRRSAWASSAAASSTTPATST